MEILGTINPSNIIWAFSDNCFYFDRSNDDCKIALKAFASLPASTPRGFIKEDVDLLQVAFDDEFIYAPYSTALKGLRDLDIITNNTNIQFQSFQKKASLVFKQIYAFEKNEVLNFAERELEFSVGRFRYA